VTAFFDRSLAHDAPGRGLTTLPGSALLYVCVVLTISPCSVTGQARSQPGPQPIPSPNRFLDPLCPLYKPKPTSSLIDPGVCKMGGALSPVNLSEGQNSFFAHPLN